MSTNADDQHGDSGDGDQMVTISRANIRKLEAAAKAASQHEADVASLRRELAFRDAGINPTDPKLKYFVKGYDGDATVEAIKAAALEAGFIQEQAQQSQEGQQQAPWMQQQQMPSPAELMALAQANAATAAAPQTQPSMDAAYMTALAGAKSPEEIMAVVGRFGVPTPGIG